MSQRDCKKIRGEDYLKLILSTPYQVNNEISELATKLDRLATNYCVLDNKVIHNSMEINKLRDSNLSLTEQNLMLKNELEEANKIVSESSERIDQIDQYTRINNLKFVGVEPQEGVSEENLILDCIRELDPDSEIHAADIDTCHPLPSNRRDDKNFRY